MHDRDAADWPRQVAMLVARSKSRWARLGTVIPLGTFCKSEVFPKRRAGKLLPKHVFWAGRVVGDLFINEVLDPELGRHLRCAKVMNGPQELLPPLLDAVLVAAKPDWWTMTGWERGPDALGQPSGCAYQQSWVLIPVDQAR